MTREEELEQKVAWLEREVVRAKMAVMDKAMLTAFSGYIQRGATAAEAAKKARAAAMLFMRELGALEAEVKASVCER